MNGGRSSWRSCRDSWVVRKVWLPVWAVLSCLLLAPSLMALAISPDRMNSLAVSVAVPHRECPLCGMTRGYAEMARGDIRAAWGWNRGAPVLFMAGLLNGGAAAVYLAWCWRRRAGSREKENIPHHEHSFHERQYRPFPEKLFPFLTKNNPKA